MKSMFKTQPLQFSGTNRRLRWINNRLTYLFNHPIWFLIIPWGLYFLLDMGITYLMDLQSNGFIFAIITAITGYGTSWLFFFRLFPGLFIPEKYWHYSIIAIGAIILLGVIRFFLLSYLNLIDGGILRFLVLESLRLFNFVFVTFTLWIFYAFFKMEQEKSKTEIKYEQLKVNHTSLQLSPHFLMNLIADIGGKSLKFSPSLSQDIDHFSNILKYGYKEVGEFNSLASELDAVRSYLHSQRLRFMDKLVLNFNMDEALIFDSEELFMAKMLLLSIVENMFKHGDVFSADHPCNINAEFREIGEEPTFYFEINNTLKATPARHNSGFGLKTIQNLLKHYFPDSSITEIKSSSHYSLILTIPYGKAYQTWPNRR